jgi:hypothetical protein
VPITMPNGVTIRTVTFWYPGTYLGIDDWTVPLAALFDDEFRPQPRLLARTVRSDRHRALLAAPRQGHPIRCAGGRLDLLDLAATTTTAEQEARTRHAGWARTRTVRGRRPGQVETGLLQAGRRSYVTYHSLRRVVGDALITMRTGQWLHAGAATPQALVDYVHEATSLLADAAPHDVLVTVAA